MIADRYATAAGIKSDDLHAITVRLERALLGATATVGQLPHVPPRPEDFATEAHRLTWGAILAVAGRGDAPVLIPVVYELETQDRLRAAGGDAYLAGCMDSCDCSEMDVYARLVTEAARARKLKRLCA